MITNVLAPKKLHSGLCERKPSGCRVPVAGIFQYAIQSERHIRFPVTAERQIKQFSKRRREKRHEDSCRIFSHGGDSGGRRRAVLGGKRPGVGSGGNSGAAQQSYSIR